MRAVASLRCASPRPLVPLDQTRKVINFAGFLFEIKIVIIIFRRNSLRLRLRAAIKNEWTRCGVLRNFRFRIRYNPEKIRRMVAWAIHRIKTALSGGTGTATATSHISTVMTTGATWTSTGSRTTGTPTIDSCVHAIRFFFPISYGEFVFSVLFNQFWRASQQALKPIYFLHKHVEIRFQKNREKMAASVV